METKNIFTAKVNIDELLKNNTPTEVINRFTNVFNTYGSPIFGYTRYDKNSIEPDTGIFEVIGFTAKYPSWIRMDASGVNVHVGDLEILMDFKPFSDSRFMRLIEAAMPIDACIFTPFVLPTDGKISAINVTFKEKFIDWANRWMKHSD